MISYIKRHNIMASAIFVILILFISIYLLFFKSKSIEEIKDSVVKIIVYDEDNKELGMGSGFCAYYEGYIITNYHVISGASKIEIIDDDKNIYEVIDIVIFDANDDLAIIETNGKFKPISLASGKNLSAGQKVTAIGSPKGILNTVSTGIISNADEEDYIRFTAPISPGSSGGVLLNDKNKVIGITTATYNSLEAQNINFARSVEKLEDLYNALKKQEYAIIDSSNRDECLPGIFGDDNTNELIIGQCDFTGYRKYATKSISDFYLATNQNSLFEMSLENEIDDFSSLFNSMSDEDKKMVVTYFNELLEFETCYSPDIDELFCSVDVNASSFQNWSNYQYILELNILERYQLAIFLAELQNYKTKDQIFNYVNSLELSVGQKVILLLKFSEYSFNDINSENKNELFEYLDNITDNTKFLGILLEDLGYEVKYNNDETLTAYWN